MWPLCLVFFGSVAWALSNPESDAGPSRMDSMPGTSWLSPHPLSSPLSSRSFPKDGTLLLLLKEALYRIWCGVNMLGDSGVKVV